MSKAQTAARRAQAGSRASRLVVLAILVLGAIAFLMPFYVSVAMSLKTPAEIATTSMWSWPKQPTLENFRLLLTNPIISFPLLLKNTAKITSFATFGVLFSSSVVAYGFARMQFAGRDRLFLILLATMMLPGIVTMIPSYVVYAKMHWVDTFLPLTVPAFFGGGAFNIFLLRQFYMGIPRELDEAAFLDGASHWTIYRRITLPLSGPALATVGLFTFMGAWRDFTGPLMMLNDPDKQTLEVGLRSYQAMNGEKWNMLMAGSVMVSIPLIILFFIGQRWFVKGIVLTGGK
ncbi:carbohydrate ABC transporter permease [Fimbriimonas ginsengisoli]|uniref:N-Acetyl-D-glucosamine ABC transport system, permease protein 2 n=1 Tax=Fimbriimonas ginsengisoli Gsoil 348 TaxID=661478 RepID=A0A068NMP9_FIMGI|nr:carbohydrate ABC transporter permease [Fimbriimonas ginsengisoli]AIE84736.1 N-Acetyl-D-glucosamine ABC transport system, permease protein 2 [Fimbriimonas ginsengisoli Gsoil 348]